MEQFYGKKSSARTRKKHIASVAEQSEYRKITFNLGTNITRVLFTDPKLMGFILARYKFVAKMLESFENVLEIGCQEGFGSMIVAHSVRNLVAIDFYKPYIESCLNRLGNNAENIEFRGYDILDGAIKENFDAAFALDVIEHIDPQDEEIFMTNVSASLSENGVFIIGSPSLESQHYASTSSKIGHINCKTGQQLRDFCKRFFCNVFMFGMNDEVVHTGFLPMAHYLIALCVDPKR
jgi:2-polyprenyl-3-methyl-5-hydroxy-6-metoxy-1,4-benzoquinol methylase